MPNKAYQRGYNKAKFYNNGNLVTAEGGQQSTAPAESPSVKPSGADNISSERGNVSDVSLAFATEYNGREWGFVKSEGNKGPEDLSEFVEEGKSPRQGDLIHSSDGYLYVLGGPELNEGLSVGWYRTTGQAGSPPAQ